MSIAYTVARLLLGFAFVAAAGATWVLFVGAMQLFSGALLLANRFVPLALTTAGGILFNIVAVGLWMLVAIRHRATSRSDQRCP